MKNKLVTFIISAILTASILPFAGCNYLFSGKTPDTGKNDEPEYSVNDQESNMKEVTIEEALSLLSDVEERLNKFSENYGTYVNVKDSYSFKAEAERGYEQYIFNGKYFYDGTDFFGDKNALLQGEDNNDNIEYVEAYCKCRNLLYVRTLDSNFEKPSYGNTANIKESISGVMNFIYTINKYFDDMSYVLNDALTKHNQATIKIYEDENIFHIKFTTTGYSIIDENSLFNVEYKVNFSAGLTADDFEPLPENA